nr:hypothetical protein [Tanacetum cinerariifolium]
MIAVLQRMHTKIAGYVRVNDEHKLVNATLTAELEQCKIEMQALERNKVKHDLDMAIFERNKRNAELEEENVMLKSTLKSKVVSIENLQQESKHVLSEKTTLEDKYLEEIVVLTNANKVATHVLKGFQMPTHTILMLSKRPNFASHDLHKTCLGYSNPRYGKQARITQPALYDGHVLLNPNHQPTRAQDSEESLVHAEVCKIKMAERPGHALPINYAKSCMTSLFLRRNCPENRRAPSNTGTKGILTSGSGVNNSGKKVICYNCHGEGHVARQCKEPKRGTNGSSPSHINEVQINDDSFFGDVSYLLAQEMQQEEHLNSEVDSVLDDNMITYNEYQNDSGVEAVPTVVSADEDDKQSMIALLQRMHTEIAGYVRVNNEHKLVNATLTAELERCKIEMQALERNKVKHDLDMAIVERNKRNDALKEENVMLKSTLKSKVVSIENLQQESKQVLSKKKTLEDKYLEEIVVLTNANKVATNVLKGFQMPTHTIPMLSKRPNFASRDLRKTGLGYSNPSEESLVHAKVCKIKMAERQGHALPINYAKLNALYDQFVPQKELSREQVYWLPAAKIASQSKVKEFERIFDELDVEYERILLVKKNMQTEKKNLLITNECLIANSIVNDICSIALAYDLVVPPSFDNSHCMLEELRTTCDREHSKVLELEAEILKRQQVINGAEKRCAFFQNEHVKLQLKFQKYKECDTSNSTASNTIFEINKLKEQLQGRDDSIRNLQAQNDIMSLLNVGSTDDSCNKLALETELTQLKDTVTSLKIQNDGYKDINANLNMCYEELSKANTHL